jgi:hypothetical protein
MTEINWLAARIAFTTGVPLEHWCTNCGQWELVRYEGFLLSCGLDPSHRFRLQPRDGEKPGSQP